MTISLIKGLIIFVFELVFNTFKWVSLKINIGLLTPIEGIKHDIHTYICADDVHANGLTWCFSEEMKPNTLVCDWIAQQKSIHRTGDKTRQLPLHLKSQGNIWTPAPCWLRSGRREMKRRERNEGLWPGKN